MYLLQAMISVFFFENLTKKRKSASQNDWSLYQIKKNPQEYINTLNFVSVFYCGICCGLLGVVKIMIYNHTRDGHYEPSRNVGICVFFFKILFFILFFGGRSQNIKNTMNTILKLQIPTKNKKKISQKDTNENPDII